MRYRIEDVKDTINELLNEDDRVAAIVGGSFLDGALDYAITARLIQLRPGEESALYKPGGPLSGCDQKIKMAHALGLFGPSTKGDAEYINQIRNVFAHNMNPTGFASPDVAALCNKIRIGSERHGSGDSVGGKERFVLAVQWIAVRMIEDANDHPENRLGQVSRYFSD